MNPVDPRVHPSLVPPGSRAVIIAEHQDEYVDLPSVLTPAVFVDGVLKAPPYVITRWTLTAEERVAIARGEDLYITLIKNPMSPLNPMMVSVGPADWSAA